MPKRSKSSQRWLDRQRRDRFVQSARSEGHVSRAHYKLEQLDKRFKLLRANTQVLELGAAPGGWTEYLAERLPAGRVIAVDTRPIAVSAENVVLIEGRVGDEAVHQKLAALLGEAQVEVDLVLSDMAPNISGVKVADQARSMDLVELATEMASDWLKPGGDFVVKIMQGDGVEPWLAGIRGQFAQVQVVKPAASRSESRENYAIARNYRPNRPSI